MTTGPGELSEQARGELRQCYELLRRLTVDTDVPSVRAAARAAVGELHAALAGQALEFDYYSGSWVE